MGPQGKTLRNVIAAIATSSKLQLKLAVASIALGCWPVLYAAYANAVQRRLGMGILMLCTLIGGLVIERWIDAAIVCIVVNLAFLIQSSVTANVDANIELAVKSAESSLLSGYAVEVYSDQTGFMKISAMEYRTVCQA